jgi:hypothetical protein
MAISASGAQAGMWMVNKANVGTGVELKVEASVELEGGSLTILTTSGGNKIAITCTKALVASAVITLETITGTVNVSGCTTKINEKATAECNPLNQPIAEGAIIKAVLHEGKAYAKAEGVGGVFATIKFNEETCVALPPSVKITGTLWLEDCNNEFGTEKVTHLFQEAKIPAEKLGGLFFGGNKKTIDGSINLSLSDVAHKGMTFSGLAE